MSELTPFGPPPHWQWSTTAGNANTTIWIDPNYRPPPPPPPQVVVHTCYCGCHSGQDIAMTLLLKRIEELEARLAELEEPSS